MRNREPSSSWGWAQRMNSTLHINCISYNFFLTISNQLFWSFVLVHWNLVCWAWTSARKSGWISLSSVREDLFLDAFSFVGYHKASHAGSILWLLKLIGPIRVNQRAICGLGVVHCPGLKTKESPQFFWVHFTACLFFFVPTFSIELALWMYLSHVGNTCETRTPRVRL